MITPMTKYSFILLTEQTEGFLRSLSEIGLVDIQRGTKPMDDCSLGLLSEIQAIKKDIACIENGEDEKLKAMVSQRSALARKAETLKIWGNYDPEKLEQLAAQGIKLNFFKVASKKFEEVWKENYPLQIINEIDGRIYFVIPSVSGEDTVFPVSPCAAPDEPLRNVLDRIDALDKDIVQYRGELEGRKSLIPSLEATISEKNALLERNLAKLSSEKAAEETLTTMIGFAPTEDDAKVSAELDKLDAYYFKEDAKVEDNPPIKLKNNKFSSMFEVLTGMYGMPVYNEFDPTIFLSIFFLLFFAMCMGDAGYGILLILIGLFLKGKEGGLAKLYKLIITLGIGTFVVGIFMGACFGVNLTELSWIPDGLKSCMITGEIAGYSAQMVFALGIGIFHLCLAMIVKAVYSVKMNGFMNSLSSIGWTLLIVGTVLVLSIALIGLVSETTAKWIIIGIAAVSALGIYIFNKIGRNPLANIGSGLWDTYNMASGLMGDVLSYIRLYALGLSGGMLGSTFNSIGKMVLGTDPTWQWLPFVLILVIGHALNLAMSCLGAFVHPLRLNFVEFFKNSGYEGRGATYRPLKEKY